MVFKRHIRRRLLSALPLLLFLCLPARALAQHAGLEENLPTVEKITIKGNEAFGTGKIKDQMRTREEKFWEFFKRPRYRKDFLRRDMASIEAFYHRSGYLQAKAEIETVDLNPERNSVRITISIREGEQTQVGTVSFLGHPLFAAGDLERVLAMGPGKPYNPAMLGAERYSLLNYYLDRGYLTVQVEDSVLVHEYRSDIAYRVEPGKPYTIRSVRVEGNRDTKNRFIERELTFETGGLCRLDKIVESKQNLFNTGLFIDVEIRPVEVDTLSQDVALVVRVRERKMAFVQTGIGYGNVVGNRFLVEFGHRNVLGIGLVFNAGVELSYRFFQDNELSFKDVENTFRRLEGDLIEPRFLGTRWGASIKGFDERDATVEPVIVETLGAGLRFYRRFGTRTQLSIGATRNRVGIEESGRITEESTTHILSVLGSFEGRDDFLNPTTGTFRQALFNYSGGPLGGDSDFYQMVLTLSRYGLATRTAVWAFRAKFGIAEPFGGSGEVPFENRFFGGGTYSVRGYPENSLGPLRTVVIDGTPTTAAGGGDFLLLLSTELRYRLPVLSRWHFSGAVFLDSGNVWADVNEVRGRDFRVFAKREDVTETDYRYAVGFGIRYDTPVGPIRLDFGIPIKPDPGFKHLGILHFGLGQAF